MKSLQPLAVALAAGTLLAYASMARADDLPALNNAVETGPHIDATLHTAPGGSFPAHSFFDVFVEITLPADLGGGLATDEFQFQFPAPETPIDITLTDTGTEGVTIDGIGTLPSGTEGLPVNFDIQFIPLDLPLNPRGSVDVSVPEPDALLLIGGGLIAIGAVQRARRRRK